MLPRQPKHRNWLTSGVGALCRNWWVKVAQKAIERGRLHAHLMWLQPAAHSWSETHCYLITFFRWHYVRLGLTPCPSTLTRNMHSTHRHECHGADYRSADQHPGPYAGGPDHVIRVPLHRLWLHRRLEPLLHVPGVCTAVEGLPEDTSTRHQGRPEGTATGAQAAQHAER